MELQKQTEPSRAETKFPACEQLAHELGVSREHPCFPIENQ